ncbi:Rha family transcriptional regulator [Pectobacterium versatile]|uniref:Rha family transcriptional regulator n=1 Tax=Pectobacterium versatile TaxID=2488639 RepID=UPI001F1A2A97|nr:Rha family transcriptional regulator [Pectobacterium versatile]
MQYQSVAVIPAFDFREMVMTASDKVLTTSMKVAQFFGKRHDNVLRKVRQVIDDCPHEFAALNFEETDFIDKNGDVQPMFNMTKDAYMLVVMGFTGKAAMQIKITYIQAFNWMAGQIQRRQLMGEEAMHQLAIKDTRSKLKGTIGSRLMNERKKEIPLLRSEEERVRALNCPPLFDSLPS